MKKSVKQMIKKIVHQLGYDITLHKIGNHHKTEHNTAFIHIPKCGGTSIDNALRSQLAHTGEHKIVRGPLIESSLLSFNKAISSIEDSCAFSEHHCQELQRILSYHLSLNWHFVSGHLPVNAQILTHFTDRSPLPYEKSQQAKLKQPYHFITVLRDPVERLISNYIFNKLTNKQAIMSPNCLTTDNVINEAKTLLNSQRGWHMANTPSMFLTGRYAKNQDEAKVLQQEVYTNLAQFSVIGFLEDLPQFEQQCTALTNKKINIEQLNVTKNLKSPEQEKTQHLLKTFFQEKQTQALLQRLCAVEIETYNEVRSQR